MNLVTKRTGTYINSRGEVAPFYETVDLDAGNDVQEEVTEPSAEMVATEELYYAQQCSINNQYDANEDESLIM